MAGGVEADADAVEVGGFAEVEFGDVGGVGIVACVLLFFKWRQASFVFNILIFFITLLFLAAPAFVVCIANCNRYCLP